MLIEVLKRVRVTIEHLNSILRHFAAFGIYLKHFYILVQKKKTLSPPDRFVWAATKLGAS